MKVFKLAFFFILLSISSFAKDSTAVEFKRFALGIHASPDYCFRSLSSINYIATYRNNFETPMLSYSAGADLSFYIKKQFSISLGATYTQKGFQAKNVHTTDINGQIAQVFNERHNYNYIEIPLKANFLIGKNKVRMIAGIGVAPSFLLYEQTIRIHENDNRREKLLPNYIYNPFNLFLNGSIGIDCKLGKRMGLRIEPTYSYGLFETISASYSEHLWSAGLNVGCYIGF